ncbi:ThiJ/PfpI family protein [Metarhizium robertsii ARSEF 23]|nr:ThiJ/PfpI family protein [Metarhizium robertsii ARSEF 23]EFY94160.2 ThiJ/PfpI family protein [Metarhizium robertsii ARSEF 23]
MLQGVTQTIFGATQSVLRQYSAMVASEEWKHALRWSTAGFDLDAFDAVFLPGGQEKTIRQLIDSPVVHKLLADYFPQTRKPAGKAVGAICYGVKVLAQAKGPDGRSILYGRTTTTLPALFEKAAFWVTWPFMGDYFKVYGASGEDVEASVVKVLSDPACLKSSWALAPFVVEDPDFNYASGRHPGDAQLLAERLVDMIRESKYVSP